MKSFLKLLFLLYFTIGFSQEYSRKETEILMQVSKLDSLMEHNDNKILNLLADDVSFGHSNAWVQNYEDFRKDFESGKVKYQSVKQTELKELKFRKKLANIRRIISVKGLYNNQLFSMQLSVLEIWIHKKGVWKLWTRQSVGLKS
ncbi:nuclear transport factor 2 family protein [Chryseobacterium sp. POL2]|uniref:nuclear transport factor 2 family protein n=1 Tax=Chryseobacterium sp. POL2 TaxID=2713414 RepID=UPI0013E1DDAF|nr:nuclear transport factor 2 family protein [Chryseobacterium sp. POL2]QIG90055.1 nuclear transport factor 2 family protein [Chryseobacterium sp. POL2]